jgi:hypothetical protein
MKPNKRQHSLKQALERATLYAWRAKRRQTGQPF